MANGHQEWLDYAGNSNAGGPGGMLYCFTNYNAATSATSCNAADPVAYVRSESLLFICAGTFLCGSDESAIEPVFEAAPTGR